MAEKAMHCWYKKLILAYKVLGVTSAISQIRRNGALFIKSLKIILFLCGCLCRHVAPPTENVLPQSLHR